MSQAPVLLDSCLYMAGSNRHQRGATQSPSNPWSPVNVTLGAGLVGKLGLAAPGG